MSFNIFDPSPYTDKKDETSIDYKQWSIDLSKINDEAFFQKQALEQFKFRHPLTDPFHVEQEQDIMTHMPLLRIATALNNSSNMGESALFGLLRWLCGYWVLENDRFGMTGVNILNQLLTFNKDETPKEFKKRCSHLLTIFKCLPTCNLSIQDRNPDSPIFNRLSPIVRNLCAAYNKFNDARLSIHLQLDRDINSTLVN